MNLCPFCHRGQFRRRTMIYLQWHGKCLLVVERMPAHVCDVCQEQVYDSDALAHLQYLLWSKPRGPVGMSRPRVG